MPGSRVAFRFGSTSAPQQPSARTRNVVEDEGAEGVVHWLMMLMWAASGKRMENDPCSMKCSVSFEP